MNLDRMSTGILSEKHFKAKIKSTFEGYLVAMVRSKK